MWQWLASETREPERRAKREQLTGSAQAVIAANVRSTQARETSKYFFPARILHKTGFNPAKLLLFVSSCTFGRN